MDTVTVLMSTYNGEKYIGEQIDSLLAQQDVNVRIFVRDDGSTDTTCDMLDEYQRKGILTWYTGPNMKSARSFMDLVMQAPDSEYYAFCDQDDVWKNDKLIRAITSMRESPNIEIPQLYCSNYQLVDEKLNPLPDNGHVSTTTFAAALVSSCCTGCTTVFNKCLLTVLRSGMPDLMVMHDDWVHKVCLAVGGNVFYDEYKSLYYRQHEANVDGGIHTLKSKVRKVIQRIHRKDRIRSAQLENLLNIYKEVMPEEHAEMLKRVAFYHKKGLASRIRLAMDSVIITPYKRLNRGYRLAIIFNYF